MNTRVAISASLLATFASAAIAQAAEHFDSGLQNQSGLVFTPDGRTAYWSAWNGDWGGEARGLRTIYTASFGNNAWSTPAIAPFSGDFNDDDPFVSPDGRWLYFVSDRPVSAGEAPGDSDIWRVRIAVDVEPECLDINSDAEEYSPIVTESGALYFASARDGGRGQGDLYRAAPGGSGFAPPVLLGPSVNSSTGEWNLWVSTDEQEILFEASSRSTNVSVPGDLYYSWLTPAGWTAAVPVARLNSKRSDLLPRLHPDGNTLYFTTAAIGGHAKIVSADWHALADELRNAFAPTLLVANRSSHEVTFVDLAKGEVTRRIETGAGPHLLSNVEDGRFMATGFGEFPRPHDEPVEARPPFEQALNSRLTAIDVSTGSVVVETVLDDCARPHASWIVGEHGYVTCQDERAVLEIDLATGQPGRRFDTMQDGTHVLSFEPKSRTLAATNTDSGSVTLIDIDSGEARVLPLAGGSEGVAEIGGQFWVGNAWQGSVSVVDPASADVLAQTERLCNFPISLSPDRDMRVWIACFGSGELLALDRETLEISARHELGAQPLNLLVHPERPVAYASLPRENAVAEIDLGSGEITRRIPVGIEPDGLRWAADD